jgi:hypothetical protein
MPNFHRGSFHEMELSRDPTALQSGLNNILKEMKSLDKRLHAVVISHLDYQASLEDTIWSLKIFHELHEELRASQGRLIVLRPSTGWTNDGQSTLRLDSMSSTLHGFADSARRVSRFSWARSFELGSRTGIVLLVVKTSS